VSYRCQGCRNYHRDVYRRLGLGSVCSPECEATVRAKQRGVKKPATASLDDRDSDFVEPAPGTGDQVSPGTGDQECPTASGLTDDTTSTPRDGHHDSDTGGREITTKKTPRGELPATCRDASAVVPRQDHLNPRSGTATSLRPHDVVLERDRRCRFCGVIRDLHVHHINYRSQGGNHDAHNLIVLCHKHHRLVHSDKGVWQPILRAYIWLLYMQGQRRFLLDIKRTYGPPTFE